MPTLITGLPQSTPIVQVTAGVWRTAYLTTDGLVFVCGAGRDGRLGVGDTEDRVVPTLVRGELEGRKVLQVDAGNDHTMCVTGDGCLYSWGSNAHGQLGTVESENLVPTQLRGRLENQSVVQVAAGALNTAFLTADGLVFACGIDWDGQLGIHYMLQEEDIMVPTLVTGQLQGKVVYIAAGYHHTLCITVDGSIFAWGDNTSGQLGVGDTDERRVPTLVTSLQGKQVVHVAAGPRHTVCTTTNGSVFTWGDQVAPWSGKLCLGGRSSKLVPTQVAGGPQNKAVHVAAGDEHSICVDGDGCLYTWGSNEHGQLGVAHIPDADLPVLV